MGCTCGVSKNIVPLPASVKNASLVTRPIIKAFDVGFRIPIIIIKSPAETPIREISNFFDRRNFVQRYAMSLKISLVGLNTNSKSPYIAAELLEPM